ncbi:MAG TPA: YdeI/OmpD-associated family protein [Verrucomicrobiae bacterium]|nr:YdeI/OmpD-associated family protein [Verrucomicrobiae bacterium]
MPTKMKAKRDSRVDAYIAGAPDFAKPILSHLRELIHAGCPEVEETMKWSRPHFLHNGLLCGMSAFKQHCAFGFWLGEMVLGESCKPGTENNAMGHFGRIASLADLPGDKELLAFIRKAAALNESGAKRPAAPRPVGNRELTIPDYFTAALKTNRKALAGFEAFSYSHKKEYVEWITEAKREETRQNRIETMLKWLAEGKSRNWKYTNC